MLYKNGLGVEHDYEKAVEWFQKAAEQGNAWSLYMMGFCNEYGQGTERNSEKAIEWYQKAADLGNEQAQEALKKAEEKNKSTSGLIWARKLMKRKIMAKR